MILKRKNIFLVLIFCIIFIMTSYPLISSGFGIPSVGLCVEKTGLTEKQCQEKMKNFGNMSSQEKVEMKNKIMGNTVSDNYNATSPKNSTAEVVDNSVIIENKIKKARRIKIEKENQFAQILEKVQKITDFLQSKNSDVSEIEKNINTFNEKTLNVVGAYDKYIELLKENRNTDVVTQDAAQEARKMTGRLIGELVVFSRTTLQENLRLQLINVSNN